MSDTRDTAIDTQSAEIVHQRPANAIVKPFGRPSTYSVELAQSICDLIVEGLKVPQIAELDNMPPAGTIRRWLNEHEDFRAAFDRAREASVEALVDENHQLGSNTSNDVLYHDGRPIPNGTAVKRAELRMGYNQWLMGKWSKRYADKQHVEHSGSINVELDLRIDSAIKRLEAKTIDVTPLPQVPDKSPGETG